MLPLLVWLDTNVEKGQVRPGQVESRWVLLFNALCHHQLEQCGLAMLCGNVPQHHHAMGVSCDTGQA